MAKEPVAGRSKTRLCPPLTPTDAARVAEAALLDTLEAVRSVRRPVRRVLALDGRPGNWPLGGLDVLPQRGGGLADRLAALFDDLAAPALVIGADAPELSGALLDEALAALAAPATDAVLGPADDGGYWAVGLHHPCPQAFEGVPMSSPATFDAQRERLLGLDLRTRELPSLRDVDTIDSGRAAAQARPGSRFARALRRVDRAPARSNRPQAAP